VDRGWIRGYPVAEGQTFVASLEVGSTITGYLMYDEYDAGDITSNMPCGTDAKEFLYAAYGRMAADVNTAGTYDFTVQKRPAGWPSFPFAGTVPADSEAEVLAGVLGPLGRGTGTGTTGTYTQRYRLVKGREVLLDPDRVGIIAVGSCPSGSSAYSVDTVNAVSGWHSTGDPREALFFDPPLFFGPGEDLKTSVVLAVLATASTIEATALEPCYIIRMRKV